MSNYTPGPWIMHSGMVWDAKGEVGIARMDRDEPNTEPCERDNNARLIAAAPELLEALKNLLPICDNDGPLLRVYQKEAIAAEKAIAKAEGQ